MPRNIWKELKEIASIVERALPNRSHVLNRDAPSDLDYVQLYNLLLDPTVTSEEEGARKLGKSIKDRSYKMLRSSLRLKLLNTLFIADFDETAISKYALASHRSNKDIFHLNTLVAKGARQTARELAPSMFALAHLYQLFQQEEGGADDLWVAYHKGNKEGLKWILPQAEAIWWSTKAVAELRGGEETNSRWQGDRFFATSGFGWVDYFTDKLKCFYVEDGVYSKNIVKLHSQSDRVSDEALVCIMNSSLISYLVNAFIASTHTLQINDGRLIPIIVPSPDVAERLEKQFAFIKDLGGHITKALPSIEREIDRIVNQLY